MTDRILFVTLSNIGDLVMTTPVLAALHDAYPDRLVDIVADPRSSDLLVGCPYLGEIFLKRKKSPWWQRLEFIRTLRQRRYELIIDLRGVFLSLVTRHRQCGLKQTRRDKNQHAVEHHFTALKGIIDPLSPIPDCQLWLTKEAVEAADHLFAGRHLGRCLALAPGANWPGKIWPVSAYQSLLTSMKDHFDSVCIVGGPDDVALADHLASSSLLPSFNLCAKTTLSEAAACLSRCSAFVGNDSGLGHIAAAVGIPSLTVFGVGDPARYRPWGRLASFVTSPNDDLSLLSADTVAERLGDHLKRLETF